MCIVRFLGKVILGLWWVMDLWSSYGQGVRLRIAHAREGFLRVQEGETYQVLRGDVHLVSEGVALWSDSAVLLPGRWARAGGRVRVQLGDSVWVSGLEVVDYSLDVSRVVGWGRPIRLRTPSWTFLADTFVFDVGLRKLVWWPVVVEGVVRVRARRGVYWREGSVVELRQGEGVYRGVAFVARRLWVYSRDSVRMDTVVLWRGGDTLVAPRVVLGSGSMWAWHGVVRREGWVVQAETLRVIEDTLWTWGCAVRRSDTVCLFSWGVSWQTGGGLYADSALFVQWGDGDTVGDEVGGGGLKVWLVGSPFVLEWNDGAGDSIQLRLGSGWGGVHLVKRIGVEGVVGGEGFRPEVEPYQQVYAPYLVGWTDSVDGAMRTYRFYGGVQVVYYLVDEEDSVIPGVFRGMMDTLTLIFGDDSLVSSQMVHLLEGEVLSSREVYRVGRGLPVVVGSEVRAVRLAVPVYPSVSCTLFTGLGEGVGRQNGIDGASGGVAVRSGSCPQGVTRRASSSAGGVD